MTEQRLHVVPPPAEQPDPNMAQLDIGPQRESLRELPNGMTMHTLYLDSSQALTIPRLELANKPGVALEKTPRGLAMILLPGVVTYLSAALPTTHDIDSLASAESFSLENITADIENERAAELRKAGIGNGVQMPYHNLIGISQHPDYDLSGTATEAEALGSALEIAHVAEERSIVIGSIGFLHQPLNGGGMTLVGNAEEPTVVGVTFDDKYQIQPLLLNEKNLWDIAHDPKASTRIVGWLGIETDGKLSFSGKDYPLGTNNASWPSGVFHSSESLAIISPETSPALSRFKSHIEYLRTLDTPPTFSTPNAAPAQTPGAQELDAVRAAVADTNKPIVPEPVVGGLFKGTFDGIGPDTSFPGAQVTGRRWR